MVSRAEFTVTDQGTLTASLARYSSEAMLLLPIEWECSSTADDVSDLSSFLESADKLTELQVTGVDLRELPDDECARLAQAIGRLPSLEVLNLAQGKMSPPFIHRLAALLKVARDGTGDISSDSPSPPSESSSRDVTRTPSTSSAAVSAGPAADQQHRGGADVGRTSTKDRPFSRLRMMFVTVCSMSFGSYLSLLEGLCGRSFAKLELLVSVDSDGAKCNDADKLVQASCLQSALRRFFATVSTPRLTMISTFVEGLEPSSVADIVVHAATSGLATNPNRAVLKDFHLDASATTTEALLTFAVKNLTLSVLGLYASDSLGRLIRGGFLWTGGILSISRFTSLLREAVGKAHAARESELVDARSVTERQWAADDARLPPAADAAEEDRRMAAREKRDEGLLAEEKEIRSSPPFLLDLRSKRSSCRYQHIWRVVSLQAPSSDRGSEQAIQVSAFGDRHIPGFRRLAAVAYPPAPVSCPCAVL